MQRNEKCDPYTRKKKADNGNCLDPDGTHNKGSETVTANILEELKKTT